MLRTIEWTGSAARLLDQTRLPAQTSYLDITDEKQMGDAIRRLVIRGAPAIGIAAAFGAYLGIRHFDGDCSSLLKRLDEVCDYLATSRPTAVNLFWALDRIKRVARQIRGRQSATSPPCHIIRDIQEAILNECLAMIDEDDRVCRAIGVNGLGLLKPGSDGVVRLLTHCNAGGLATAGYGTALAPIYVGNERGMKFHVYADETRPLLQGSRITAFELKANGIPVTVICDNMAATVLSQKKVDAVIVGADRIAANGDVANKIGTMGVAILARHFGVPFFVAAPMSTIDAATQTGKEIPIEQRDAAEISRPPDVPVYNPAFDVTPCDLVTAIITERGVNRAPYNFRR